MGCDIECYVEFSPPNHPTGETLQIFGEPLLPRFYQLFGLMAGVRGPETLFSARGLPTDSALKEDYENNPDNHHASYLSHGELKQVYERLLELTEDGTGTYESHFLYLRGTLATMASLENDGCEIVRLVFWFN